MSDSNTKEPGTKDAVYVTETLIAEDIDAYLDLHQLDFRGFSGLIASGSVKPGDAIRVLPSGKASTHARGHAGRRPGRGGRRPVGEASASPPDIRKPLGNRSKFPTN